MSKKEHLDEFLRNKLNQLPDAPVGSFEKVESRMATNNHRGILVLLLVPFLVSGLFWLANFTEQDLFAPVNSITKSIQKTKQPSQAQELLNESKKANEVAVEEIPATNETQQEIVPVSQIESSPKKLELAGKKTIATGSTSKPAAKKLPLSTTSNHAQLTEDKTTLAVEEPKSQKQELAVTANNEGEEVVLEERFISEQPKAISPSEYVVPIQPELETSVYSESQDYLDEDVREEGNWSVTMNVYPNYTFREFKLNPSAEYHVHERYEDIINDSEKGGFAFNAGVDVRYHLGNNMFIGTGLGFIQTKINGRYNYEVDNEPVFDDNGNIYMYAQFIEPVQVDQGIIQTYRFLQMPLHVSYQPWASEKLRLIIEGGFSYIHFLSADGQTIDHENLFVKDLSTMRFNRNMASMDFKVGVTYYPTPNVAFGVEPTLMYFNSSIYAEDYPVYVVPWSVGVNLNLRIRLL